MIDLMPNGGELPLRTGSGAGDDDRIAYIAY
jgi:hypothetical protein